MMEFNANSISNNENLVPLSPPVTVSFQDLDYLDDSLDNSIDFVSSVFQTSSGNRTDKNSDLNVNFSIYNEDFDYILPDVPREPTG